MRVACLLLVAQLAAAAAAHSQHRDSTVNDLFQRARAAQHARDHARARALYDSVLALDSTDVTALNNRGNTRRRLGDARGAIADYNAAIRLDDRYALAYRNRAAARKTLGDSAAMDDLDRAIALNPTDKNAWYDRGVLKWERGVREDGLVDIRRAAALGHAIARDYLQGRGEKVPAIATDAEPRGPETTFADFRTPRLFGTVALLFVLTGLVAWVPLALSRPSEIVEVDPPLGERRVWVGAPRQGLILRSIDGFMMLFGILWTSMVVAFAADFASVAGQVIPLVVVTPMVLFGWYMVVGRIIHDVWRRRHTVYLLTDRSVSILRRGTTVRIPLDALPDLILEERPDGTGTISFGPTNAQLAERARQRGRVVRHLGGSVSPAFELIPDASRVFQLVQRYRDQALAAGAGSVHGVRSRS